MNTPAAAPSPGDQPPIRAAAYVRMSTEHQQYSTSNQMDVIREYATRRNMEIVMVYSDEGKSGLSIQGRASLAGMIADVESKRTNFSCILVYDVSRWGRFQDADESAYYEYLCKRAGIAVHYCAEQFENDGSNISSIFKSVKRGMAGEYSRELSAKVFRGACRLIQLGFKQGGTAGFGLRRMLVDHTGQKKGLLKMGEHKSIQTDRVILVPGPEEEVEIVRWMYNAFVNEAKNEGEIMKLLNERGILTDFQRPWTRGTVHEVLTNEKYLGHNVYHRTSCKLKQRHVENPPEKWIRADNAFVGIIDSTLFLAAQSIILTRSHKWSDEEMLEKLRGILTQHGRISGILIDEAEDLPSSSAFRNRFGSLVSAYRLIGYDPEIDYSFIEINRQIRKRHPEIVAEVLAKLRQMGSSVSIDEKTDLILVNEEWTVSIVLCRYQQSEAGTARWVIRLDEGLKPDITIAVRMDETNTGIRDYYLLPALDMTWGKLRMAEENGIYLDAYQFAALDYFYELAERCRVEDAA
jgi:DNA invertase Pin-like site-specific DNA recombinase